MLRVSASQRSSPLAAALPRRILAGARPPLLVAFWVGSVVVPASSAVLSAAAEPDSLRRPVPPVAVPAAFAGRFAWGRFPARSYLAPAMAGRGRPNFYSAVAVGIRCFGVPLLGLSPRGLDAAAAAQPDTGGCVGCWWYCRSSAAEIAPCRLQRGVAAAAAALKRPDAAAAGCC